MSVHLRRAAPPLERARSCAADDGVDGPEQHHNEPASDEVVRIGKQQPNLNQRNNGDAAYELGNLLPVEPLGVHRAPPSLDGPLQTDTSPLYHRRATRVAR